MAVAALPVAQELSLDVPRDLPVVAWDDSPVTQVVRPQLTAPTRDIAAYGARATENLLELIGAGAAESVRDLRPASCRAAAPAPRGADGTHLHGPTAPPAVHRVDRR